MLAHSHLPSCDDCEHWIYDTDTWKRQRKGSAFVRRPRHLKPPCGACPKFADEEKGSPALGRKRTLSSRNWRLLRAFCEFRGTGRAVRDPLTARLFGIIEMQLLLTGNQQRQSVVRLLGALGGTLSCR